MSSKKSMLEVALEIMNEKKAAMSFTSLWKAIKEKLKMSDEEANNKMSNFYTQLSLDGRFIPLGNNKWNLRDRLPFDKTHVDMSEIYNDMEEESDEDDDDEENASNARENKKEDAPKEEEAI